VDAGGDELGIKIIYALSPQGCALEGINDITSAQRVLKKEISRYNYRQVHSTTGEIYLSPSF